MTTVRRLPTREAVTAAAAATIRDLLRRKPDAAIGLATGRTQEPLFAALISGAKAGEISFARTRFFHLDEYWGLPAAAPESMSGTLRHLLLEPLGVPESRFFRIDGRAGDWRAEAVRYESAIRAEGGIDLQLLGMGTNGHIAFNEPGSPHDSRTRLITLTEETRHQNRDFFPPGATVPAQALSMGIATILEARTILILVTGTSKIPALRAALEQKAGVACPASALQDHPDCTFLCDEEAAGGLTRFS
jgi:glucosamine-6-phosphate deaminase